MTAGKLTKGEICHSKTLTFQAFATWPLTLRNPPSRSIVFQSVLSKNLKAPRVPSHASRRPFELKADTDPTQDCNFKMALSRQYVKSFAFNTLNYVKTLATDSAI
jgi:hypothetical protein